MTEQNTHISEQTLYHEHKVLVGNDRPVHLVHPRLLLIESMGDNSQQRQMNVSERLSKIPITHSSCALISMCFKLFVSHVFLTGVKAQCLMTCHQAW